MEARESIKGLLKWVILALLLAAGLKLWLAAGGWVPFNADEAVVALMARHILQGARPVFFYGQAYMGSLDAFLVAGAFSLFGQAVWAIRLVQGLLYLGTLATTAWLGRAAFGSWWVGVLAMLLLAIPTVNVTLYTTASLGGYGEALLIGNLILICGIRIAEYFKNMDHPAPAGLWGVLGFLSGLGLWAFGISLVYSLPVLLYLLFCLGKWITVGTRQALPKLESAEDRPASPEPARIRSALGVGAACLLGSILGSAAWWGYALQHGLQKLIWELSGGAIAGVEGLPWGLQILRHMTSLILLGGTVALGFRPPWDVTWLALPLLPFVLLFWMAVILYIFRCFRGENRFRDAQGLLLGVMLTLILGFIFTPFGADPSGRYFVPLAAPLALFAAAMILDLQNRIGAWAYGLVALLLVYNLAGTLQSALRFPPGITTQFYAPSQVDHRYDQRLIDFLRQHGETRGYTNYWAAYPLAFLSGEELLFLPRLPYHLDFRYTERDDRHPPYRQEVEQASQVAYITTRHPDLDRHLRASFSDLGVTWQEVKIGDYTVFYHLSQLVHPTEIGLGTTTVP